MEIIGFLQALLSACKKPIISILQKLKFCSSGKLTVTANV